MKRVITACALVAGMFAAVVFSVPDGPCACVTRERSVRPKRED